MTKKKGNDPDADFDCGLLGAVVHSKGGGLRGSLKLIHRIQTGTDKPIFKQIC